MEIFNQKWVFEELPVPTHSAMGGWFKGSTGVQGFTTCRARRRRSDGGSRPPRGRTVTLVLVVARGFASADPRDPRACGMHIERASVEARRYGM